MMSVQICSEGEASRAQDFRCLLLIAGCVGDEISKGMNINT